MISPSCHIRVVPRRRALSGPMSRPFSQVIRTGMHGGVKAWSTSQVEEDLPDDHRPRRCRHRLLNDRHSRRCAGGAPHRGLRWLVGSRGRGGHRGRREQGAPAHKSAHQIYHENPRECGCRPSARWHCTMHAAQCRSRPSGAFASSGTPRSPRYRLWPEPRHSSSMPTARSSMCMPWSRPCRQ